MKIIHITSIHHVFDDRIFERACRGTARKGHDVTLIATHNKNEVVNNITIIGIKERKGWRKKLFSSNDAYKIAARTKGDVYHFHDPDLLPWMVLLAWQGKKVVYDIHENYRVRFTNPLLKRLWRGWERWCIKQFAGIVVVTASIAKFFEDVAKQTVLVSNMPDIERLPDFTPEPNTIDKVIYVSGNNTPTRNVMQLIEAMPSILKQHDDAKLIFAGFYKPEGYLDEMKAKAKQLNVTNAVTFDGALPWAENFKRTAKATIGCVFWQKNENYANTIPNRLFEYMFSHVAVVSDDTPELRRIIDAAQCGIYANSDDPQQIAKAIIQLLDHPDQRVEYARNGRKAVFKVFNFNTELERMLGFYNKL